MILYSVYKIIITSVNRGIHNISVAIEKMNLFEKGETEKLDDKKFHWPTCVKPVGLLSAPSAEHKTNM